MSRPEYSAILVTIKSKICVEYEIEICIEAALLLASWLCSSTLLNFKRNLYL